VIGIGSTLNQRFNLDQELGRGGMGAVYRATDQVLGRSVAIKTLKELSGEEVGKRIRLEAQILARLAHEHIVRLYDFGESEGMYFLVMEEVDGTSFSKRWRALPLAERLRVAAEVAEALDYAHRQGVIHRDVKPANVLLTARDGAKLSDFGLSMMAEARDEPGVIRGTPHYMSPEQARGKRLDHRTDLYSLGVMLYECATGSAPFVGQPMAVIGQHIGATPTPPRFKNPEVSPELEGLVLSLLAKDPGDRPATGQAVAQALRAELARELARRPTGPAPEPKVASPTLTATPGPPAEVTVPPTVDTRGLTGPLPTTPLPTPGAAPAPAPLAPVPSAKVTSPLVRAMLEGVLAEPLVLSPDERFLCGHYLAYLLGGSRRRGLLLRRPLDPRNADRARLLLAMTWLMTAGATDEHVARAAELLDDPRVDVRPALNPPVVVKYLTCRDTPAKRKKFRAARQRLLEASRHAREHMTDPNGVLNPGLMPQALEDLRKIAPKREEVDDQLVERWNRVSEVWHAQPDFRRAVLRYATTAAHRDPAGDDLWPEVVYPLIERARWQRRFRPRHEALWDYLSANVLRMPDAGVLLDRLIVRAVPGRVAEELDLALASFDDDPRLEDDEQAAAAAESGADRIASGVGRGVSLHELAADAVPADKGLVRLARPDPYRFTFGEIRELWREAVAAIGQTGAKAGHRAVTVGPYHLAVIPSIRGRNAGQLALQGMRNKQIEMLTPSVRAGGSASRPVLAVWVYQDASAAIAYLDFKGAEKFILWHAPNAQQTNHDTAADLGHELDALGLEVPDQLDRVLSKRFRPRNAV
jgi:serine/threonine-protein kinase